MPEANDSRDAAEAALRQMQSGEGRRERKKAAKLGRILAAARELFAEHGYDDTTTRAISERARIATGTLFSYFPDKRALLVHLFATDIEAAVDEAFRTLPDAPLVDRAMHLFEACFRWYARDLRLARSILKELLFLDPGPHRELHKVTAGFVLRIAGEIDAAKARGEVAARVPSPGAAMALFAQYYFALLAWVNGLGPDTAAPLGLLRQSVQLIHDGMRP